MTERAKPSSQRRPLQRDVAARAGVSRTTVSFVLNGVENIAIPDETRERVLAAAAELGFRPNPMARGLRGERTNVLGLLTSDIVTRPYAVEIVKGARDAALARGRTLLLVDSAKFQRLPAFCTFCETSAVDEIITDDGLRPEDHETLAAQGTRFTVVDVPRS